MNEVVVYEPDDVEVVEIGPKTLFGTSDPKLVIEHAAGVSTELAKVIEEKKLFAPISGRKHVLVEGWTLLGSLLGVYPVPVSIEELPEGNGYRALVEARTISGAVVGAAYAQCSRDEKAWRNREAYALESMAQTRATSKALRLPLGFVMTLAGYDATPAEEMPQRTKPTATAARVAHLRALMKELSGDDRWTAESVIANSSKVFNRKIKSLDDLSADELSQVIAGAESSLEAKKADLLTSDQEYATLDELGELEHEGEEGTA